MSTRSTPTLLCALLVATAPIYGCPARKESATTGDRPRQDPAPPKVSGRESDRNEVTRQVATRLAMRPPRDVRGGANKDDDKVKVKEEDSNKDSNKDRADGVAAPPLGGASVSAPLRLDKQRARPGEVVTISRDEPFPEGATVHIGALEARTVERREKGRQLRFKIPASATTGPLTVKAGTASFTTETLTVE